MRVRERVGGKAIARGRERLTRKVRVREQVRGGETTGGGRCPSFCRELCKLGEGEIVDVNYCAAAWHVDDLTESSFFFWNQVLVVRDFSGLYCSKL